MKFHAVTADSNYRTKDNCLKHSEVFHQTPAHHCRQKPRGNSIFRSQYHIKPAHNIEEALKLVDVYFEYVTGEHSDGSKIFHKRK